MSFDSHERSRSKGAPICLYRFRYINSEEFLYTNAEKNITKSGFSAPFLAIPIQHGSLTSSGTLDKANLEIRVPRRAGIVEGFRVYPPTEVVSVTIWHMHTDDPVQEALVCWTGRVLGMSIAENELASFSCEPISTSLKRSGLRRNYQIGCPHALYGAQCAASKAAATTPEIIIESVSGSYVTLTPGWMPTGWAAAGKTYDKFVGGMLIWDTVGAGGVTTNKRTILRAVTENKILISGPATGLSSGSSAKLVLGCNHQMTDCRVVHNNINNYGGQPFIPVKSPFGFNNNFY